MFKVVKKLKVLFSYLIGGYATLSNWPSFFSDLVRVRIGLRTKTAVYKLRDGTKFNIHAKSKGLNYVFYAVYIKREYDGLEKFEIQKKDTIIDIGAHLGFFTVKAAKKAVNGKVYAFEPFSMHFKLLETNIKQNSLLNVKYYNSALFNNTGELTFYYALEGDPEDTSLFKIDPSKKIYEETVKSISLTDFFQQEKLETCDLMKIDCEGAEYSILMNADSSTLKRIQKIAMEWHKFSNGQDPRKLAEYLKDSEFKLIEPSSYDQNTGFLFAYR